jgi:hypothetical protein
MAGRPKQDRKVSCRRRGAAVICIKRDAEYRHNLS